MREVHIALGLIQQGDKYLLQLRDGDAKIGAAGLIGCFGGKINEGDEPAVTFCREIFEETTLKPRPSEVKKIGMVKVRSDHNLEPVKVTGHVYHWHAPGTDQPKIKKGQLVIMTKKEALANLNQFTPATRAIFEELSWR